MCFKPSQPQRIIVGLRDNVIKRYAVETTNQADIALGEKNEKAERFVRRIYGMKVERAIKTETDTRIE